MARLTEEEHPLRVQSLNTNAKFKDMVIEFGDIFREELPEELPPSRGMDFEINLKPGVSPPVRPVIRLSSKELKELKKQLQKYLYKGFLRPSSSPYGAPVFFVKKKKKNGDLRMLCDHRSLNKITVPDSSPIPLIDETIDQVAGSTVFSQLNLIWEDHQMLMAMLSTKFSLFWIRKGPEGKFIIWYSSKILLQKKLSGWRRTI